MPKLEPKVIQKDIEQGVLWPVYWIYGQERLKIRELLKRIRSAVTGQSVEASASSSIWQETVLEGAEIEAISLVDEIRSPSLLGKTRLIVVRDAHLLKNLELIGDLLGPARSLSELMSVCVFISKDLDGRKKFSKILLEKAAVVPCEEVAESQRVSWIHYLAKRRGLQLSEGSVLRLSFLDPWSLDGVDQELEKISVDASLQVDVLNSELPGGRGTSAQESIDFFLDSFFQRKLSSALPWAGYFSDRPDEALPLLGLLAWNVKQLAILIAERESKVSSSFKLNPYLADRLRKWSCFWTWDEILELQKKVLFMDFAMKQTPLSALGVWTELILEFCSTTTTRAETIP